MHESGGSNSESIPTDTLAAQVSELTLSIHAEVENGMGDLVALPSADDLATIIRNVRQNHSDDPNLTNAVLFFVLKQKLQDLESSHTESKKIHDILHEALIAQMPIHELPSIYQRMLEGMESMHELIQPLYIGKESEAKQLVRARRARVEDWVKRGDDAVYGDLNRYMEFITSISQGHTLTANGLEKFKATLVHPNETPLRYESDSLATKVVRGVTRAAKSAAGSLVSDRIAGAPQMSKEQRAQIAALHRLVTQPDAAKEAYEDVQKVILTAHSNQLSRESKQIPAVFNELIHGRKNIREAFSGVYQAIKHPIEKVYNDPALSASGKAAKIGQIVVTKTAKVAKKVVEFSGGTAVKLAQSAVTKPIETVEKLGLATVNASEALGLALKAQLETDPAKKKRLTKQAQKKIENLGYNARKSLEAMVVSGATAMVIAATVVSAGGTVPVIAGVEMAAAVHALEAVHIADHTKTGSEFLAFLVNIATNSTAIEDKERHELLMVIQTTIQEMVQAEGGLRAEALQRDDFEKSSEDSLETLDTQSETDYSNDSSTKSETSNDTVDRSIQPQIEKTAHPTNVFKEKLNKIVAEGKISKKIDGEGSSSEYSPGGK